MIVLCAAGVVVGLVLGILGGGDGAGQEPDLSGTWMATGVVLSAHDSAIQTPGETITRLWVIRKVCAGRACHLELIREVAGQSVDTVGGALAATLAWSGEKWTATFSEPNVACATGGPAAVLGTEDSTWVISLTSDGTINATEHTRTSAPNCLTGTTQLRWIARKAGTSTVPTV